MAVILYVGDDSYAVKIIAEGYNMHNHPTDPLEVYDVPEGFKRATPDGLRRWLQGEIPEWQPQSSYAAIVFDYSWKDLVPVVKEVHLKTPTVMLLAPPGRQIAGIDSMLDGGAKAILALPETLEKLVAANR